MIAHITPASLRGTIRAIPSKSEAHRALICAALADAPTRIHMPFTSQDIEATARCLNAFGADISRDPEGLNVKPIGNIPAHCEADVGESGSTLRFLLPVAAALGIDTTFIMHGRLPQRPLFPLDRELVSGGCELLKPAEDRLRIRGRLKAGEYTLPGNVSSQYISGMLMGLSLADGQSRLAVEGKIESKPYIDMTLRTMERFGVSPNCQDNNYLIPGGRKYLTPGSIGISGDWSNAAFWLCMDAYKDCQIHVTDLDPLSAQGDKCVVDVITSLINNDITIFDASPAPDLVPTLAACACLLKKELRIIHAERLRLKESDRIATVVTALNAIGGHVEETGDGMTIFADGSLRGGTISASGDHRIAMMAAVASVGCTDKVIVTGADAVRKSYPEFWTDMNSLGGKVLIETEV